MCSIRDKKNSTESKTSRDFDARQVIRSAARRQLELLAAVVMGTVVVETAGFSQSVRGDGCCQRAAAAAARRSDSGFQVTAGQMSLLLLVATRPYWAH